MVVDHTEEAGDPTEEVGAPTAVALDRITAGVTFTGIIQGHAPVTDMEADTEEDTEEDTHEAPGAAVQLYEKKICNY